ARSCWGASRGRGFAMGTVKMFGKRRIVASIAAVVLFSGFALAQNSFAVHDTGMFELDGNTVHDSATSPPWDWNSLFDANGNRLITPDPDNGPLLASTFLADTATPDSSYFASNKDIQPIANWGCAPINNPLNKDDL